MTHDHSKGVACPACKKVINNYVFIVNLAPLIDGPEATALATAAQKFGAIRAGLGLVQPSTQSFEGCDQAQALLRWIRGTEKPDPAAMNKWTDEIWAAVDELAHGNLS